MSMSYGGDRVHESILITFIFPPSSFTLKILLPSRQTYALIALTHDDLYP